MNFFSPFLTLWAVVDLKSLLGSLLPSRSLKNPSSITAPSDKYQSSKKKAHSFGCHHEYMSQMRTVFSLILQWRKQGFEMYQSANGYRRPSPAAFCLLSHSHLSASSLWLSTHPPSPLFLFTPSLRLVSSDRLLKEIPCASCLGS